MKSVSNLLFSKSCKIYAIVFAYHLIFILFAYQFRVFRTVSDAHFYWGKTINFSQHSWFEFANYGAEFMLFLNYPLVQWGFPFWSGFLLYGIIGFLGVLKWMQWTDLVLKDRLIYKGFNVAHLLFFMPNLHVWTSSIGKEALVFWGIAAVVLGLTTQRYKTFGFIVGCLVVLIIRPHVALMLLAAITLAYLFLKGISLQKRMVIAGVSFAGVLVLLYLVFQTTQIHYWDWKRINYFNEYSILSFKHSGSYVPMLDYNYFYKWFSFHFRPLFYDATTVLAFLASIENAFTLVVCIVGLFFAFRFYAKINYSLAMKVVFLFTFTASVLYVERYANLGIFMRTKMMFHPFMIVALLLIIEQSLRLKQNEKYE